MFAQEESYKKSNFMNAQPEDSDTSTVEDTPIDQLDLIEPPSDDLGDI